MKGILIRIFAIVLLLAGIGAAGSFYWYNHQLDATGSEEETVTFEVEPGSTFNGVLAMLEEEGLIKSQLAGKVYLRLNHTNMLQANTYLLNKGMDLETIVRIISEGDYEYIQTSSFTVPEGTLLKDMASIVGKYLGMSSGEVLAKWDDRDYVASLIPDYWFLTNDVLDVNIMHPLEGYLFPETYQLTNSERNLEGITKAMLDMTETVLEPYRADIDAINLSIHEFFAFVSVVERESLFDEDRPMIASVFWNRIEEGMYLQSDITVNYALGRDGVDVTFEMMETPSPYNTYVNPGLPIGPVANFSEVTLKACVYPEDSNYFYFYACPDGTVLYGETYDEHLENVRNNPW